ncbi:MAG: hypothetical protein JWP75_2471 [Frondihabitans sp.]|nr:hypothetical protein [Frondihabitans sp.]
MLGLVLAIVASRILGGASFRTATVAWSPALLTWLGYLAVWVPLGAAVAVVVWPTFRAAFRPAARPPAAAVAPPAAALGLARWFSWRDLIWGCAAGLIARGLATVASIALTGFTGLAASPTLGGAPAASLLVVMVVAPVIVAPLVEELFFRGLLQGALTSAFSPAGAARADPLSRWTAAAVTALVFAALHVLVAPAAPTALTLASTFVLGLFAGGLVASTGRLGGAIIAHVVFNGVAVLLTWPR